MGAISNEKSTYLSVSGGMLRNKKKGIDTRGWEGMLEKITIVPDEFEGKPVEKVEVKMRDPKTKETVKIQFSLKSWYAWGFFSRIGNLDVTKQFTIGASPSDKNEKMTFCWFKQEGIAKVESLPDFPKPEKVDIDGEKLTKWGAVIDRMKQVLAEVTSKIDPSIVQEFSNQSAQPAAAAAPKDPFAEEHSGPEDDLPF